MRCGGGIVADECAVRKVVRFAPRKGDTLFGMERRRSQKSTAKGTMLQINIYVLVEYSIVGNRLRWSEKVMAASPLIE